jgi:hypothetical protein
MTLLTYVHGPSAGSGFRPKAGLGSYGSDAPVTMSKLDQIKRVGRFALAITLITVALAGIIALNASIYLARFSH